MTVDTDVKRSTTLKTKIKIVIGVIVGLLALILILQNTETVTTRVLWGEIPMPRALLLIVMLAIGFGVGVLVTGWLYRRREQK